MSRAVYTAEKRAELAARGEPWPVDRKGQPMFWQANAGLLAGGRFVSRNRPSRLRRLIAAW